MPAPNERLAILAAAAVAAVVAFMAFTGAVEAQGCSSLLSLFQKGRSNVEIARMTGLPSSDVAACRRELSQPIIVGPEGPPPRDAAGPAPRNAPGPPPVGAPGPPAAGAPGAAPTGREIKRLN